jgi:hypothetical protein
MTIPTIADYLKYASLQMAAEAFLFNDDGTPKDDIEQALIDGNKHASVFTEIQATEFVAQWEVIDQLPNTSTGFSGTLFKAIKDNAALGIKKDDLVVSFRSTEFIDDAARDSRATNELEIKEKGFAFGQLADMELWYRSLNVAGGPLDGKRYSVTGYSLGAHLATAFNLMHGNETFNVGTEPVKRISEVVTFNGAGLGRIGNGSQDAMSRLPEMIQQFLDLRDQATAGGLAHMMKTEWGRNAYQAIKSAWSPGQPRPAASFIDDILNNLHASPPGYPVLPESEYVLYRESDASLLREAWRRTSEVYQVAWEAPTKTSDSGPNAEHPAMVLDNFIAGEALDYQLAVISTAKAYSTSATTDPQGVAAAFGWMQDAKFVPPVPQYNVVGVESTSVTEMSMVANSQYRYGTQVPLYIEDQPLTRGTLSLDAGWVWQSLMTQGLRLPDNYDKNNFGDTHSLVLIVDSLAVMGTLARIDPLLANRPDAIGRLFETKGVRVI